MWLLRAGRGFGKTRAGAEWILEQVAAGRKRIALVARTAADAREVMVEGESGLLACSPDSNRPRYEPSKRRLTWNSGTIATTYSADEPDLLRGPAHDAAWCLVADTLVLMANGTSKRIADVESGEFVRTRAGARVVSWSALTRKNAELYRITTSAGRELIGTADHPVYVHSRGFVPLSELSKGASLCVVNASNGTGNLGINMVKTNAMSTAGHFCIGRFGNWSLGALSKIAISTILTAIERITESKTCKCLHMLSTGVDIITRSRCQQGLIEKWLFKERKQLENKQTNNDSSARCCALYAAKATEAHRNTRRSFVPAHVLKRRGPVHLQENNELVLCATKNTRQKSGCRNIALKSVILKRLCNAWRADSVGKLFVRPVVQFLRAPVQMRVFAEDHAPCVSTERINSVEKLARRADVYDIAVRDSKEFFANGILVHNCDELATWQRPETFDMMMFGLRLGQDPRCVVTTTPRPTKIIRELRAQPTTVETVGTTYENRENLAPAFLDQIIGKYEGTRLGRQELLAEILEDNPGALWRRDNLDANRVTQHPELTRIVVAIDPAASSGEEADDTGIIVAGLGIDGRGYVLEDCSLHDHPDRWGRAAVAAYHRHHADRIVAEVNNGGEMVEHVIRTVDPSVSYKAVHASRGKQTRAEPVAALYEQGKVHHVGYYPELEDELCGWEPGESSPDRLDALVWCLTELMLANAGFTPVFAAGKERPA